MEYHETYNESEKKPRNYKISLRCLITQSQVTKQLVLKISMIFLSTLAIIANVSTSPGRYMGDMMSQSLFLDPVTPQVIAEIIKSLTNGAPGYDEIHNKILQLSMTPIIGPLSFLCNRSLTEGVFPLELKLANVLPLFKSDETMLFNNYHPVSLLCTLSKVFEKIMYSRLLNFLDYHKILIGNQFGFRKLHSSYMALMFMMD